MDMYKPGIADRPRPGMRQQNRAMKYIKKNLFLFLLLVPGTVFMLLFYYLPYFGLVMAFQDFTIGAGFFHSPFVGLKNFVDVFSSFYFLRNLKNTFVLGLLTMLFCFPAPIVFALVLNEAKNGIFKRTVQTISYLPHFVSTVIMVGLVFTLLNPQNGVLIQLVKVITGQDLVMLGSSRWFRTIFVAMQVYGRFGWDSIIFLAALSSVDPALYEAAKIDGASRWQQMRSITLPAIMPPIVIMLIMASGSLLEVGFEPVFLLYSPPIYDVADTIQTYVYRRGILGADFSYTTALGLFVSVVNFGFVYVTNFISKKVNDISLW